MNLWTTFNLVHCEVFWILLNAVKGFFDKQLEQRGIREHQRDVTLIVNPFSLPLICHAFLIRLAVSQLTWGIFRLRPLSFSVWFMFGLLRSPQWMVSFAVIVPDLPHVFHCILCVCVGFFLHLFLISSSQCWSEAFTEVEVTGTRGHPWPSDLTPPHPINFTEVQKCQRFWNSDSALLLQLVGLSIKMCHKINIFLPIVGPSRNACAQLIYFKQSVS